MNVLVTAGNTQTPIDRVRAIANIFTGRTGTRIALEAHRRSHRVTLLTSRPDLAPASVHDCWTTVPYRTYDDLEAAMAERIASGAFDAVIHCAAVSDYRPTGVFTPSPGTSLSSSDAWTTTANEPPSMIPADAGKIGSHHAELWLRMVPTAKLIDRIRSPWNFAGTLVKFKLEVGADDEKLMRIAEASRRQSHADMIVANTLDGMHEFALIGDDRGRFDRVDRENLAVEVLRRIEALQM